MSDDRFLHELRREPRPEFAERLRRRLDAVGAATPAAGPTRRGVAGLVLLRFRPALAAAAALTAGAALFAFPSVRASAQAFLDLFRVRNFAAVPVDESRIQKLESGGVDLKRLLSDRVETVREPGEPRTFLTPEEAGAAAGIPVRTPSYLPEGMSATEVRLTGEAEARLTVDTPRLRELLDALGVSDVQVPDHLNGQVVTVRVPPAVGVKYASARRHATLMQARSPEVGLPPGTDLAQLGEIALRVAGLDAAEARRFAQGVDWSSTLLVPVPAGASSFRQVDVGGSRGLLVSFSEVRTDGARARREGAVVLWSAGEMVYVLSGDLHGLDLVQMAGSLR